MNRSAIIEQQCALIRERGVHDYRAVFDTIVAELNTNDVLADADVIQKLVTSVTDQKGFKGDLFDHQLYRIFRDAYLTILRRWRIGQALDTSVRVIFSEVASMFAQMTLRASSTDVDPLLKLLVHPPLIEELRDILTEMATDGKHLQSAQLGAVDHFWGKFYGCFLSAKGF